MNKEYRFTEGFWSVMKYILWSSLAVVAGGFIYILFRPTEPAFFNWFKELGIENWLLVLRSKSTSASDLLPQWMVYSLPNGLWAYAYTLLILIIWKKSSSRMRYFWYLSIPVLIFGFELLQLSGTLPGTFCLFDLSWGAVGICLGLLTVYLKNYQLNSLI